VVGGGAVRRDQRRAARRVLDVLLRRGLQPRLCSTRTGRRTGRPCPWALLRGRARTALVVDCHLSVHPWVGRGCGVVRSTAVGAQADGCAADSVAAIRYSVRGLLGSAGSVRCGRARGLRGGGGVRALPNRRIGVVHSLRLGHRGVDSGPRGDRAAIRPRGRAGDRGPWRRDRRCSAPWRAAGRRAWRPRRSRGGSVRQARHRVTTVFGAAASDDAQSVGNDHVVADACGVRVRHPTESNRLSRLGVPQCHADLRLRRRGCHAHCREYRMGRAHCFAALRCGGLRRDDVWNQRCVRRSATRVRRSAARQYGVGRGRTRLDHPGLPDRLRLDPLADHRVVRRRDRVHHLCCAPTGT
jgi:hypothetical protein